MANAVLHKNNSLVNFGYIIDPKARRRRDTHLLECVIFIRRNIICGDENSQSKVHFYGYFVGVGSKIKQKKAKKPFFLCWGQNG